jgi:protein-tyrosine phosphatase
MILSKVTRICFVCLGNIVRSPLAEHMFNHLAAEIGVNGCYQVDSAGTGAWHAGEAPDGRMRRVAARYGLKYTGKARQFVRGDFEAFDWIIAMDTNNRDRLLDLADSPEKAAKVRLMREFDPQGGPNAIVPDPYYGGIEGFEEVFQIVKRSCRGLLAALEAGDLA